MATETKWTPGPWRIGSHPKHAPYVADARGEYVASLDDRDHHRDPRFAADLNLIAAAPDLAAVVGCLIEALIDAEEDGFYLASHADLVVRARAALAKARGEVQS